jgi:NADPH:quinone reductase-like Zn-dependent oxidoreductase
MKAIVYQKYGSSDVLELKEVEKPIPNDNEVLIKVQAASVNPLDWRIMRGKPFMIRLSGIGLLKPKNKILGVDVAGRIEAVGKNVKLFQPGDEVFGGVSMGGFAEYVCGTEKGLVLKPTNLTFEEAAAVPVAALTALQGLRDKGNIQSGQKVLINGASGGVGTFAVQIAKWFGAKVTAVCSTRNLDMVQSIGADHVIDYTQEDFTKNGQYYDLIYDTAAYRPVLDYKRSLSPNGIYVMIGGSMVRMLQMMIVGPWVSITGSKKMGFMVAKIIKKDMIIVKELLENGKIIPVIDRHYKLSEVAEAVQYLEKGHARGKVIITM